MGQGRNDLPLDDDFLPSESEQPPRRQTVRTAAELDDTPDKPEHDPLVLDMAEELGIRSAERMEPASLRTLVASMRRQNRQQAAGNKPAPEPEKEEPIDWGLREDGTPITSEKEYVDEYGVANARTLKIAHANSQQLKRVLKQNEELTKTIQEERQQRASRAAFKKVCSVLAERPDLFGDDPANAKPGTAEYKRIQRVCNSLTARLQDGSASDIVDDTREEMELFGAPSEPNTRKPTKEKSGNMTIEEYARGQMARPSNRRSGETRSRRDIMIDQKKEELARLNGNVPASVEDDDADLLDWEE